MKALQEQEAYPKGSTEAWLEIGDGLAPPGTVQCLSPCVLLAGRCVTAPCRPYSLASWQRSDSSLYHAYSDSNQVLSRKQKQKQEQKHKKKLENNILTAFVNDFLP